MLLGNTKLEYCERWKYSSLFGLSSKCYMLQPLEKKEIMSTTQAIIGVKRLTHLSMKQKGNKSIQPH